MLRGQQVALLGDAPVAGSSPQHLQDWKVVARRALLEAAGEQLLPLWLVLLVRGGGCLHDSAEAKHV